jgi:hypothetical protein
MGASTDFRCVRKGISQEEPIMRSAPNRRSRPALCAIGSAFLLLVSLLLAGCSSEPPSQNISFKQGLLDMRIAESWVKTKDKERWMEFRLPDTEGIRLSFRDKSWDFGQPATTNAVKSMIGSQLNGRYGGVKARLTLKGNALLTYSREKKDGLEKVYTHNWVLAKPYGMSLVNQVDITLKMPVSQKDAPEIQEVIALLDKQIGDGVLPSDT